MGEMTQFKEKIYNFCVENELSVEVNDSWNCYEYLKYPLKSKLIPKSQIVYGDIDDKYEFYYNWITDDEIKKEKIKFIIRSYFLYQKYVSFGSEFEVNVSYASRSKLVSMMNDISSWISYEKFDKFSNIETFQFLFHIFDECMVQNRDLLKFSFNRYQRSVLYFEWIKLWKDEKPE